MAFTLSSHVWKCIANFRPRPSAFAAAEQWRSLQVVYINEASWFMKLGIRGLRCSRCSSFFFQNRHLINVSDFQYIIQMIILLEYLGYPRNSYRVNMELMCLHQVGVSNSLFGVRIPLISFFSHKLPLIPTSWCWLKRHHMIVVCRNKLHK